jgi:LacI family transcriptional regulator
VDGIIYAGYGQAEERLIELFSEGLPVVVVDKPLSSNKLPSVLIDNRLSISMALRYLKKQGHREILFINGLKINRNSVLRAESFKEFVRNNKLSFREENILYGDFTLEHGYETTLRILAEKRRFSALLCGDDLVAFGAMAALKSRGVRIPEDVAAVGFDDYPMAAVFDPSLTTIHYPMYEMGRRSFEVFYKLATKKRRTPEHIRMDTELIIRRSTESTYRDYHTLFRD